MAETHEDDRKLFCGALPQEAKDTEEVDNPEEKDADANAEEGDDAEEVEAGAEEPLVHRRVLGVERVVEGEQPREGELHAADPERLTQRREVHVDAKGVVGRRREHEALVAACGGAMFRVAWLPTLVEESASSDITVMRFFHAGGVPSPGRLSP